MGGDDTLTGGAGIDTLNGGTGNDTYVVALTAAGALEDSISETSTLATEIDTLRLAGAATNATAVTIALTASLANLENIDASGATSGPLNLTGNARDNILTGNGAFNRLTGGDGNDTLIEVGGNDVLEGGNGNDIYVFSTNSGSVVENPGAGTDTVRAATTWTLQSTLENLVLTGTGNTNGSGNFANNVIVGNTGANILAGSSGDDRLDGKAGNDRLVGGSGKDNLTGGTGNDVFKLNSAGESGTTALTRDTIADFVRGQDKIDLTNVDANTAVAGVDDFTTMIASGAAFTAAGQLKLEAGVLYGNVDADADAEFSIAVTGATTLSLADFLL